MYYRMKWLIQTACLCGALEVAGWSGRVWSHYSPLLDPPFQLQICATIIGPTPLLAANFVIFGVIIQRLGIEYSRLTPKWYTVLFCACDVISLIIQDRWRLGCYRRSQRQRSQRGKHRFPNTSCLALIKLIMGGNIMLGGIVFQLLTITIYSLCATEFFIRYFKRSPIRRDTGDVAHAVFDGHLKLMSLALAFNTTCLFIRHTPPPVSLDLILILTRAVYRTIELSDGWTGRIIGTQVYFNVLDGGMIILAIFTLNFAHPGVLLAEKLPLKTVNSA